MPPYVEANAEQFGTLGIILAISTWLIGFAAIMVASALVGRVVVGGPDRPRSQVVGRVARSSWARLRRRTRQQLHQQQDDRGDDDQPIANAPVGWSRIT